MNIHEHQAKQILKKYGAIVPQGVFALSVDELVEKAKSLNTKKYVLKAQIHAGGRGKAGGVELIDKAELATKFAEKWLGKRLVTYQTDHNGQLVSSILIEECTDISKELYLSAVIDRATQRIVFIGSSEGGVNIEEVAKKTPEKIIYEPIDPLTGPMGYQSRKISKVLGLNSDQSKQFSICLLYTSDAADE